MTLTHTIDLIELIWTLISIVGVSLAVDLLEQARYDRDVVGSSRPVASSSSSERQWLLECEIVRGDVASAWWIVGQEVVSIAIGLVALATPSPPGGRTTFGWAVVVMLLLLAAMLPLRLFGQRRRRRRLGVSGNGIADRSAG